MRSTWTDERLDDFKQNVDSRFDAVDRRFDKVEAQIEMQTSRIDALQHTTVQLFVTMMVTMVTGFVAIAGLIVTQL